MDYLTTQGLQTATATMLTGAGLLHGIHVITDGTNAATMLCYDNTSAAGTVKAKAIVPGATSVLPIMFDPPLHMDLGVHITISGTGAEFIAFVE